MLIRLSPTNVTNSGVIEVNCPHCSHVGSFEPINGIGDVRGNVNNDGVNKNFYLGIRRCPRQKCNGQLFFQNVAGEIETFPSQKIEFKTDLIPRNIVNAFDEALICESVKCYSASAIMVRKTLELVCEERNAKGDKLFDRLKSLKSEVTLPEQLFKAMENLRVLGNDAAHVELKHFDKITKDELDVAIDLTKEILKSIYQLDSIVERLEALKK